MEASRKIDVSTTLTVPPGGIIFLFDLVKSPTTMITTTTITMTTLGNRPKQSSSREGDRGPDGGHMADEDVPSK